MIADSLLQSLSGIVGPRGLVTRDELAQRSAGVWGPPRTIQAAALVRPASTAEVSRVLQLCTAAGQPVVTHGGLSGVVNGAWAREDELVLSMERMHTIEDIDPIGRTMRVQAGVKLATAQDAATAAGLLLPLDLGARGSATLGGNAATNAGGNQVIRYGMARQSILGLEAVLADGQVLNSLNALLKDNAGYDLKQLFIGTEGTLGVITRLVLRLLPAPVSRETALLAVPDFDAMARLLGWLDHRLGGQLSAFEAIWGNSYALLTEGRSNLPLPVGHDFYVLVEALGADPHADGPRFEAALADGQSVGLLSDAVVVKSDAERAALWDIRDDVGRFWQLRPMYMFDVSLPIRAMPDYLAGLEHDLAKTWPGAQLFVFGHLGDGNLHLAISAGPTDISGKQQVEHLVYGPLGPLAGSISAEHGIGLEKKAYLPFCRSAEEIALMKTLKQTLDPQNILNPGKVFDLPGTTN